MEILLWIGFAQSLFSATLFILVKKEKSLSNRILSAWLFIFAIEFFSSAIDLTMGNNHLTNPFLIFNPLLYFYAKSLINPGYKLRWGQIWHTIPYLFIKVGALIQGVHLDYDDFFFISRETWFDFTYGLLSVISFLAYSVSTLLIVHRYRMNLKNEFSTINSQITLGWLIIVIIFYMSFMSTAYILGLIKFMSRIETFAVIATYAFILGLLYIFSFYGLLQKQIYSSLIQDQPEKYKNPTLSETYIQEKIKELEAYFQTGKPYLDSELSIYTLSTHMKLSRHALTEILNTGLGKNFYQFVNEYRIEEVKHRLKDPEYANYTIDAIGFECGFNSKSTFYAVFKKYTGQTPSRYRSSSDKRS